MLYTIKQSSFLCFALIHNVTLLVKDFQGKISTHMFRNAFANHPRVTQNALDWRHLIKLRKKKFINVCSDDCLRVYAVKYLLPLYVFHLKLSLVIRSTVEFSYRVSLEGGVLFRNLSRVMRKTTFWFPTWSDTNLAIQSQKIARGLKSRI